ncbi:MAG: response regulator [Magnetococcales bacterium]|nr:response regulator [Magnetococcales bacterium]
MPGRIHCGLSCRFLIGCLLLGTIEILWVLWGSTSSTGSVIHAGLLLGLGLPLTYLLALQPLVRGLRENDWTLSSTARLNARMRGITSLRELAETALGFLAQHVKAQIGAIYLLGDAETHLELAGGYGLPPGHNPAKRFNLGEGLPGQVALDKKSLLLRGLAGEGFIMDSGTVAFLPHSLALIPLLNNGQSRGVLVLGSVNPFDPTHVRFLERMAGSLAIAFGGARAALRNRELLDQTQQQKNELAQHQKLLNDTIKELEQASRYKSRFLASMSHELRSPLNSLLILSKLLEENRDGNLTPKQVEFAQTIHAAGTDLLELIEEVLDLARIEAGRVRIYMDRLELQELADSIDKLYRHVAHQKNLGFRVILKEGLPEAIHSDRQRVEQILKNLISNALKFTEQGAVTVDFHPWTPDPDTPPPPTAADQPPITSWIAIAVSDTGLGIPPDQLKLIFEPFRQVDNAFTRKIKGTGLGLAICQELSILLKGRIEVASKPGEGSVFTLYLPGAEMAQPAAQPTADGDGDGDGDESTPAKPGLTDTDVESIRDDRRTLRPDDRSVLIIGNDHDLVRQFHETIQGAGFGVVVSGDLGSALFLAKFFQPAAAVLATPLPGVDTSDLITRLRRALPSGDLPLFHPLPPGAPPLELDQLTTTTTTHRDDLMAQTRSFLEGILAQKPATPAPRPSAEAAAAPQALVPAPAPASEDLEGRQILVIEDDMRNIFALTSLLEGQKARVLMAKNGVVGLEILQKHPEVDLVLLDIMMPDMDGYQVLREIRARKALRNLPVLVLTARAMQGERRRCINAGASDYLPKPVDSPKLLAMIHTWLGPEH